MKHEHEHIPTHTELLRGGPIEWEKPDPDHTFRGILDGTRGCTPIYEDDLVFAFHADVDTKDANWERHVVIIPKRPVPCLLDMGIRDNDVWCALLNGIQVVARKLNLHKTGFIVRANVLPPYQHTPHVHLHILEGKKPHAKE